jgi:hypothetical protein
VAGGKIGRDGNAAALKRPALDDGEVGRLFRGDRLPGQIGDAGGGRRQVFQPAEKPVQRGVGAEGLDGHARVIVAHAPGDAFVAGETIDPGTKADALHDAADLDSPALSGQRRRRSRLGEERCGHLLRLAQ